MGYRAWIACSIAALIVAACGDDDRAPATDSGTAMDAREATDGSGASDVSLDDAAPSDAPRVDAVACPMGDLDGDGHASIACGGDDCDDEDATRFGHNAEICDPEGTDDDCDPGTLGPDEDFDGHYALGCCNRGADGELDCGDDCYDLNGDAHPAQTEFFESERGDGSFDYDCDETIQEQYPSLGGCIVLSARCSTFYEGWRYSPVPDCGGGGSFLSTCISGGEGCILDYRSQGCR